MLFGSTHRIRFTANADPMSKSNLSCFVACVVSLLLSSCASTGEAPQATPASATPRFSRPLESVLDGSWKGSLAMRPPFSSTARNAPPDPADLQIRLVIEDEAAKVFLEDSGQWIEAMPGKLALNRIVTSASVVGANSDVSESSGWIENWSILVTAIDDDSLQAEWTRVVNNLEPGTESLPTFSMAATGVLKRETR